MPNEPEQRGDFDSPWKDILSSYFEEFIGFFFPQANRAIDWSKPYQFLDTELQQIVRDAELGKRIADKLAQVWLNNGESTWVLVHIEIQNQPKSEAGCSAHCIDPPCIRVKKGDARVLQFPPF